MGYTHNMEHPLERQFVQWAKVLWPRDTPLIAAISGGVDSMALYALLESSQTQWPVRLIPVHVDHQLRPESGEDARWLTSYLDAQFGAMLRVVPVTVCRQPGESLEMAARRVRYQALWTVAEEFGPDARLAVAHQLNDQAETVLMRAVTGAGIQGLAAMRPRRGRLVRPLLHVSRGDLEAYLRHRKLVWRDDPSNADPAMVRNRIRHEILPRIEACVNPRAVEALAGLADRAAQYEEVMAFVLENLDDVLAETDDGLVIAPVWRSWPEALTKAALKRFGLKHQLRLEDRHLQGALQGPMTWPQSWQVRHRPDGALVVCRVAATADPPSPERVSDLGRLSFGPFAIEVQRGLFETDGRPGGLAIDAIRWPVLWLRTWRPGDRFHPLGMGGHGKKLQDLFVDAKIPEPLRGSWPVVVADLDAGPILAVLGLAVAEEARAEVGDPVHWLFLRRDPQRPERSGSNCV